MKIMDETIPYSLLGLDLGSVNVKLALCDRAGAPQRLARHAHQGRPLEALRQGLEELAAEQGGQTLVKVGVAGCAQDLLGDDVEMERVNEVVATAAAVHAAEPDARTIVDIGGQFSKWILLAGADSRQPGTVLDFATNGLCAAGSGAFLQQQASRLRLEMDQLGELAVRAERAATIAGRCSVFAKSDMIHLQQKGTPMEEIALGLCLALVRTFLGTVLHGRTMAPPMVLVGGGAEVLGIVRAFRDELRLEGDQLRVAHRPVELGAVGAAGLAGAAKTVTLDALLEQVGALGEADRGVGNEAGALAPLDVRSVGTTAERPPEDPAPPDGPVEAYLGVDVGSVSTNVVLMDADGGVIQGIYLPTRGQPVAVLQEALERVSSSHGQRLKVLGVGTTGSGRHLAARVLGADVVHNEITAQTVSSARYLSDVDTIFEIGGQDSKFVSVRDGHLADFEMNKICAAGTGSFLEEQAQRLGIEIVDQFSDLALAATRPVDLGTRCTVFMDAELVRAQQRGAAVEDLCAGLAYSVARNYLDKVVAGRHVGQRIIFQGGTASNRALVVAFSQLLGRPVEVHPYNRISGALGAALLAARAKEASDYKSNFLGLEACDDPSSSSFECPRCENRCQVNRIELSGRVVHFGDVCERFAERDRERVIIERPFPELFATRDKLLEAHITQPAAAGDRPGSRGPARPRIGLARASLNLEYLPFWTTFLTELGFEPVVSRPTSARILARHARGVPSEVCLPIKAGAAHVRHLLASGDVERVFLPSLMECPPRHTDDLADTCIYTQQLADMLSWGLGDRLISAQFVLQDEAMSLVEPLRELARTLDRSTADVALALVAAREVYNRFVEVRVALGRSALDETFDRAVVVLGRPYNTHDAFLNLSLARHLDQIGLPAIPGDMLPLSSAPLAERWQAVPWHFSREQLRAVRLLQRDGRLFPLFVSNYGCGVDGFAFKHFEELLAGRPRLMLEFDEHRGEAGLVTRLEAFSDEIDAYIARHGQTPTPRRMTLGTARVPRGRRIFVPHMGYVAPIHAASFQAEGLDAEVLPEPDEETVRLGEEHGSGRECHPWVILCGELIRLLRDRTIRPGDVFLSPGAVTPCLLRQYGDAFRIMIKRLDLPPIEVWDMTSPGLQQIMGYSGGVRLYEALLAADILFTLSRRLNPYADDPGLMDRMMERGLAQVAVAQARKESVEPVFSRIVQEMWQAPHRGRPGERPVVGVTGDLYTRIHPTGNSDLFSRLEAMGCEVWPSPYYADSVDLASYHQMAILAQRGRIRSALEDGVLLTLAKGTRYWLTRDLPQAVRDLAVEPSPAEISRLAAPYVGSKTNFLVIQGVAKLVDFLQRGASGAINAAGLNCMVGTATSAAVPLIRERHDQAPVVNLTYGGSEGPAQRIWLETFVHQVETRYRAQQAQDRSLMP